ncbi:MAG: cytochrome c biogenesis protein ResB [Deltaproteobacteria bacterium]|nr:cytochrome c biogenesis protein ResB [Deltaproteobacteria bacterium]
MEKKSGETPGGPGRPGSIDETVRETVREKAWYKRLGSGVWRFFNSLKLTISVLLTTAVVSIAGTVIPQGQPVESYAVDYGERWARFILSARLNDTYHSPWFTSLIVILGINITVCTIERFPPKWKTLLNEKTSFNPAIIDRLSTREAFELPHPSGVKNTLERVFKKNRYRIKSNELPEGGATVYAWKGLIGRFGSDMTHLSLILILTGTIIGSYRGFRDFLPILVDSTVDVPNADFSVRLDRFWIDYYDTGQIKQYNSILTVVDGGRDVLKKQIWVNEPLYYKGFRFYQSSYGVAWDRIKDAELALKRLDKNEIDESFNVGWGERKEIPGTAYSVRLIGYVSDFAFDRNTKTVFSKSGEATNPAVRLEVYEGPSLIYTPWIFLNYPGAVQAIPGAKDNIVLAGFRTIPYSGIAVNKDPGTNVVWAGCILMGAGFFLAFFVYHRRIWASVEPVAGGTLVRLGGMINKNPLGFEREFKDIVEAVRRESGGQTPKGSMEEKR